MSKSTRATTKVRAVRNPEPGTPIQVRLQPALLAELDAWIAADTETARSRPEAIREALTEHLKAKGYLK
ncbi:ribbon-helix-helix protein, CopG family [Methylobacterium sp. A49B]